MSLDEIGTYIAGIDYAAWADSFTQFAKDWQTMIAGVLALAGAWATVSSVNRQIEHNDKVEERRRCAEARAAKAMVPMALSELSAYAETCIKMLAAIDGSSDEVLIHRQARSLPRPPVDLMGHFKEAIRFSDGSERDQMASLLSWFQVHEARLSPLRSLNGGIYTFSVSVPQAIVDAAELHARATKLFNWARGNLDRMPRDEVQASVRLCLVDYEEHPHVMRIIESGARPPANP